MADDEEASMDAIILLDDDDRSRGGKTEDNIVIEDNLIMEIRDPIYFCLYQLAVGSSPCHFLECCPVSAGCV
jgi:hypothetical protein